MNAAQRQHSGAAAVCGSDRFGCCTIGRHSYDLSDPAMQLTSRGQALEATKRQEPSPRRGLPAQRPAGATTRSTSSSAQYAGSCSVAASGARRARAGVTAAATGSGSSLSSKGRGGEAPTQEDLRCAETRCRGSDKLHSRESAVSLGRHYRGVPDLAAPRARSSACDCTQPSRSDRTPAACLCASCTWPHPTLRGTEAGRLWW